MKRALLSAALLLAAMNLACLPGQGENQSCSSTPACQARMICLDVTCLGSEVSDGGQLCKFECTTSSDCPNNESCIGGVGPCAHCDSANAPNVAGDGG
jgi:hypothetical protein